MTRKRRLDIREGTDQYSIFRFFTVIMLFVICFVLLASIRETRINRERGYQNRAVTCAILKSQVIDDDVGSNDEFMNKVYHDNCENDPTLNKRYPDVTIR